MSVNVFKATVEEILPIRKLFLQENNFQIRYNAYHERGWTDSYILDYNGNHIGYSSIKGKETFTDRDTVFEFYIVPSFRRLSTSGFSALINFSKTSFIECQSNDVLLTSLQYEFAQNINSNVILFEDSVQSSLAFPDAFFRSRTNMDIIFEHKGEPVGDYVLEYRNEVIATGGFLLHYNEPFADLHMEVREDCRKRGFGSFLIQELKRQCYFNGRVPAARCNIGNIASRLTLQKAGFKIAGFMLSGSVKV